MRSFKEPERYQLLLLTNANLETAAPIGSAVRTIDELAVRLDTSAIEATYDLETERGQNPINPKTMRGLRRGIEIIDAMAGAGGLMTFGEIRKSCGDRVASEQLIAARRNSRV